jgi:hypothetical protein
MGFGRGRKAVIRRDTRQAAGAARPRGSQCFGNGTERDSAQPGSSRSGKYSAAFGENYLANLRQAGPSDHARRERSDCAPPSARPEPRRGERVPSQDSSRGFLIHPLNLAEVLVGGVRASRDTEMLNDLEAIGVKVADRPDGEPLRLAHQAGTDAIARKQVPADRPAPRRWLTKHVDPATAHRTCGEQPARRHISEWSTRNPAQARGPGRSDEPSSRYCRSGSASRHPGTGPS